MRERGTDLAARRPAAHASPVSSVDSSLTCCNQNTEVIRAKNCWGISRTEAIWAKTKWGISPNVRCHEPTAVEVNHSQAKPRIKT